MYGTTKAALAELARALRAEEPYLRVLCVAVGNTASSFADNWDPDVAVAALEQWVADGLLRYEVLQCDEMADAIAGRVLDPSTPDDLLIAGAEVQRGSVEPATIAPSAFRSTFSMAVRGSSSTTTTASGSL